MADKPTEEEAKTNPEEAVPSEPPKEAEEPAPSQPPEEAKPSVENEAEEATEPEAPEDEEKPPSRRESLRIQQLLEKMKTQPQSAPKAEGGIDYGEAFPETDPEVVKQLEQDRQKVAAAQYQEGLRQAQTMEWRTMVKVDEPSIVSKYPQLNAESQDFNPVLAKTIQDWFVSMAGYNPGDPAKGIPESVSNPNLRYSEFVDGIMELSDEVAGEKTAETRKNITRQAAKTGIRPTGGRTKGLDLSKAPQDMSKEELEAVIAQDPLLKK